MEHKLFEGDEPHVSTFEFHEHRERAPHWEQPTHQPRLAKAVGYVYEVAARIAPKRGLPVHVVDLGCGDGGLLQQLKDLHGTLMTAVGFDFQPSNEAGWRERGVEAYRLDFVKHWTTEVPDADIYVITECLEHLADPHHMVSRIRNRNAHIVASSPWTEHYNSHDECHAWAWDQAGYRALLENAGFRVAAHETVGMFQIIWGTP